MRKDLLPKLFDNLIIRGAEADDEESEDQESEEEESEEEDDEGQKEDETEDTTALKSALRKERNARKKFERDFKRMQKLLDTKDEQEKSEADKAKDQASKAESRALKLAERLKVTAVDNAIIKAAQKLKFRDIDDALKLVDRGEIDIDQDEDDPTTIELDEGSVTTALESLAKAKPHLIVAEGQEERSGSKFGGARKSKEGMDDQRLMESYDAFRVTGRQPASHSQ